MPNNTILDEVYAATLAHIAALEADKRTDFILAWDYGLGVKYGNRMGDKHLVVRLLSASSVSSQVRDVILNGAGIQAKVVRRDHAIAAYLPSLRASAAQIKATIDQHEAAIAAKFNALREALA